MDWQQPAALFLVALAALYLGRNLLRSARSFRQGRGCGEGCGKCAVGGQRGNGGGGKRAERPGVIPLTSVGVVPKKRDG